MPPRTSLALGVVIGASLSGSVGSAFKSLEEKAAGLGKGLEAARLGQSLTGEAVRYKGLLQELQAKKEALGRSSQRLNQGLAEVERRYREAKAALKAHGLEVGQAAKLHEAFTAKVGQAERALERLTARQANRQARADLKTQALGALGPVAGALAPALGMGAAFHSAMEFESAQVRLRTVIVSKDVEADLAKARKQALAYARGNLSSEVDVLNVNYALNSAGLEAEAARLGSEVVLKVAKVTAGLPEQVGEVVATTFNNLGGSLTGTAQQKLERIGDLLTKAQFKFQIRDFGQLGEGLKYAAPTMSAYNVELEQGVTLIGALNSAGLQGSQAGTAFGAMFRSMSEASKQFGFELVRNNKGQLDFVATLESLSEAIGGFDNLEQQTIDKLQSAFGDEGVRGVMLLGKNLKQLKADQEDVAKTSQGVVKDSYQHFVKSSAGQWQILQQNLKLTGQAVATTLLPGLSAVMGPLTMMAQGVGSLVERYPFLGQAVGGLVVGLMGLKAAAFGGRYAFSLLSDGWQAGRALFDLLRPSVLRANLALLQYNATALVTAVRARALSFGQAITGLLGLAGRAIPAVIGAMKSLNLAFLTSPVGLIIAGIALAAGLIIAYWEPISDFFVGLWEKVKVGWQAFLEWLGPFGEAVGQAAKIIFWPVIQGAKLVGSAFSWIAGKLGLGEKEGSEPKLERPVQEAPWEPDLHRPVQEPPWEPELRRPILETSPPQLVRPILETGPGPATVELSRPVVEIPEPVLSRPVLEPAVGPETAPSLALSRPTLAMDQAAAPLPLNAVRTEAREWDPSAPRSGKGAQPQEEAFKVFTVGRTTAQAFGPAPTEAGSNEPRSLARPEPTLARPPAGARETSLKVEITQNVHLAPGMTESGVERLLTEGRERLRRAVEEIVADMYERTRRLEYA